MTKNTAMTCVDLFAGCGGLSLGLKQAGFKVELAVEKSPMAAETYYHNFIRPVDDPEEWNAFHEDLSVEEQADAGLVVRELEAVLGSEGIISRLREADIDLVAGGPPCQGFSLAGRRDPHDKRNQLPWQFLSFVALTNPKAVIIENVSGFRNDFRKHSARSPFEELRIALAETGHGYAVQPMLLNAVHFGVPQHRPRVFLVGLRSDLATLANISVTAETWDSSLDSPDVSLIGQRPALAPQRSHFEDELAHRHLTVADAIADLVENGYDTNGAPSQYAMEMRSDSRFLAGIERRSDRPNDLSNHVRRQHSDLVESRFSLYQYFRDAGMRPGVLALPLREDKSTYWVRQSLLHAISNVQYPVRSGDGTVVARNQRALMRLIGRLATKKHSQRALAWEKPAPTVVSLPDDYVHPSSPRVPTVRELARFQSFPDAFEFRSKETTGAHRRKFEVPQYTQVGNAVPPRLGCALGSQLLEILNAGFKVARHDQEATAVA
jgi:DNA (cytosine-5)-methyltransferase 1